MQDFSEKNFSRSDHLSARRLIFVTAVFGGIFSILSLVVQRHLFLTKLPGLGEPLFVLLGSAYAVLGIFIYREIALALLNQVRGPLRVLIALILKGCLVVLLLIILKMSSRAQILSVLLGVFSFVPAVLWVGLIQPPGPDAEKRG